jgi:hypothetical protein
MTNPTTPFGWQMPTSTDLVTDLPADFETFGQAVATSMADLLGGTTGQVLSKASNTNMDFTWVTTDDANAIQNAIVDAKGDLIAASAADTPARLAVGANNTVLVADSATATGLKWAGAWTAYTPTLTNITLGNGGLSGRYSVIGKTVNFEIELTLGSTSVVSSYLQMTLPVNASARGSFQTMMYDDSAATWYEGYFRHQSNNSEMYLYAILTNGAYASYYLSGNNVPFTWATSDYLTIRGSYEAA